MNTNLVLSRTFVRLILPFFCVAMTVSGQVLSIQEIDREGERTQIDFTKIVYPIVDVNSTLSITINKDAVRKTAAKNKTVKPPVDSKQLDAIAQILREEAKILGVLGPCTGTYEQCRNDLRMFSNSMLKLEMFIQSQKTLAAEVDSLFGLNIQPDLQYQKMFELVRNKISKAGMEISNSVESGRIYFRLGGWIRDNGGILRPIHIPQFDTYADGSFYEVPRFVTPTPEELRKQYSDAADAANEYNKNGSNALDGLASRINTLRDSVQTILLLLNDALRNTINLAPDVDRVKKEIKPFTDQLSVLVMEVDDLEKLVTGITRSSNPLQTSVTSIEQIFSLLQKIQGDAKALVTLFDPTLQQLQKISQSTIKTKLDSLSAISTKCVASLTSIAGDIGAVIAAVQQWIQMDVPKQTEVNLEFGEQVKQFLIEDVPDSTEVDLRYTGQRSAGDEIFLKASLEDGTESKSGPSKSTELERRTLTMYQIEPHAKLAAGAIFLSPFEKSKTSLTKQFQAAPSYNVMVKWGSRSSYAYNSFWSLGLGVNVAAPDFNLDSTPEIGLGVVASTAMDYLQLGFGRNFGVETWYWFFGLQLPVGTIVNPSVSLPENK